MPSPKIWSDATAQVTAEQRASLARVLAEQSEAQGFLAAGYMEMFLGARMMLDPRGEGGYAFGDGTWPKDFRYDRYSGAGCTMTVRHPKGVGSGWAGNVSYDWAAINSEALASRAIEKCKASLNPVAIEPGRYTVVLEPQAVSDLVRMLFWPPGFGRRAAEMRDPTTYWLGPDQSIKKIRSKLGLKIVDERITLSIDLMDPMQGSLPSPDARRIAWIDKGVLTTLGYPRDYALLEGFGEGRSSASGTGFHMTGGQTSIEEMIETTKRGLLVTRFSNMRMLDGASVLCSGLTRDGLWLIENGKISKAVKNMRITESPLFVLNQIEQLGVPVPTVWAATVGFQLGLSPAIVPPLKARDFSFTSMIDAV